MGVLVSVVKRVVYFLGYPFYGYSDARFREVLERLYFQHGQTKQLLEDMQGLRAEVDALNAAQTTLRQELRSDARVASESGVYMDTVAGRVEALLEAMEDRLPAAPAAKSREA